jgi:hypothetical protein
MDYGASRKCSRNFAVAHGSKVTVACTEVALAEAVNFGVVQLDERGQVRAFDEKPPRPAPLMERPDAALASMGIYAFDADFLYEELRADARDRTSGHDFGKDILPRLVKLGIPVHAHRFSESCVNMARGQPYWRDVGTVDAYWEANLDLTQVVPDLNMYDQDWPIWTCQEQLPPAKFVFDDDDRRGYALDSLVSGGCIISGSKLKRSLLFSNVRALRTIRTRDPAGVDIGRGVVWRAVVRQGLQASRVRRRRRPDGDRQRFADRRGVPSSRRRCSAVDVQWSCGRLSAAWAKCGGMLSVAAGPRDQLEQLGRISPAAARRCRTCGGDVGEVRPPRAAGPRSRVGLRVLHRNPQLRIHCECDRQWCGRFSSGSPFTPRSACSRVRAARVVRLRPMPEYLT